MLASQVKDETNTCTVCHLNMSSASFTAGGACGVGYEDAKYCYPFDNIFKTSSGDLTPEVISNKKNAELKVN